MTTFAGALDAQRPFEMEFIHQHLDAYLDEIDLLDERLNALTSFFRDRTALTGNHSPSP